MKYIKELSIKLYAGGIELNQYLSELYKEEIVDQMRTSELVNDLMFINFKNKNWYVDFEKILEKNVDNDELFSKVLKNYCLQIIESIEYESCESIVLKIADLYDIENDVDIVRNFYYLEDCFDGNNFLFDSKKLASSFLNQFDIHVVEEKYKELLYNNPLNNEKINYGKTMDIIDSNLLTKDSLVLDYEEYKRASIIYFVLGIIKTYVGIVALEKGIFMYTFLVVGLGMFITSIYYLILLFKVNKKLNKPS